MHPSEIKGMIIVRAFGARVIPATIFMLAVFALVIACSRNGRSANTDSSEAISGGGAAPSIASLDPAQLEAEMIRRNGSIFDGWQRPKLALVFTGLQGGYIEPCGCSGKENQKGGLSRRDMFFQRLAAKNWPFVAFDLGEQVSRFGRQQEIKYRSTVDALKSVGYRAIGFGPDDLRLSAAELFSIVPPEGNQPTPFVCANAGLFGFDDSTLPRFQVIQVAGLKIGVTSIIGDTYRQTVNNQDIQFLPADKALADVVPKLVAAKCDLLVLLSNATKAESTTLAQKFPQFNIVVTAGGADEPPARADLLNGDKTQLIELGHKGMYAIVLGLYDDAASSGTLPIRYQRVPLDARFGESPKMKQVLASYQEQLQSLGLDSLGIKPAAHPSGHQFVGSQTCGECHTKAFAIWKKTPHAKALDTLVNLNPSRQYDAECLSCHVTGWEPQKFTPYSGGYLSEKKTPLLAGNGCENCHGPGSAHVAAETGAAKATELDRLRKEMHLSLATDADRRRVIDTCMQCHDTDNSIDFKGGENFDKYWAKIEHHEKD